MRSIIQEAPSISKAIELGWIKAGKPKDFNVKIFEDAHTRFFGFYTVKNAKVGIFIEDRAPSGRDGGRRPQKHAPQRRRTGPRSDWRRPGAQGPEDRRQEDRRQSRDQESRYHEQEQRQEQRREQPPRERQADEQRPDSQPPVPPHHGDHGDNENS